MSLALRLGFFGAVCMVFGCSSTGPTAPDREDMGESSPEVTSDPAPAKKAGAATPGAVEEGVPVPYPNGATPPVVANLPVKPKSKMTFFVTSTGSALLGGNLGGLAGADKKCQDLATAAAGGDHTWHAYLSVVGTNARDRIGAGPWTNQKGVIIAENVTALHDYVFIPKSADVLDEKGAEVPKTATSILTGTKLDGTALGQTCQDWTSNTAQQTARVGESASDTTIVLGARWNDSTKSNGCSQQQITQNKGEGRLYCFAID